MHEIAFHATTCVTLIAYCELLAELAEGRTVREAAEIAPSELIAALPGVHPGKLDRAHLAIAALRNALEAFGTGNNKRERKS